MKRKDGLDWTEHESTYQPSVMDQDDQASKQKKIADEESKGGLNAKTMSPVNWRPS